MILILQTSCSHVFRQTSWLSMLSGRDTQQYFLKTSRQFSATPRQISRMYYTNEAGPVGNLDKSRFLEEEKTPAVACETFHQSALFIPSDFSSSPILYAIILFQSIFVLVMGSWRRSALNIVLDIVWQFSVIAVFKS